MGEGAVWMTDGWETETVDRQRNMVYSEGPDETGHIQGGMG